MAFRGSVALHKIVSGERPCGSRAPRVMVKYIVLGFSALFLGALFAAFIVLPLRELWIDQRRDEHSRLSH